MSFKQFVTCSRPGTDIPFFEQEGDGKVRSAILRDMMDSNPDLVTTTIVEHMDDNPELLEQVAEYDYVDYGAFISVKEMFTEIDPTYKKDRFSYYSSAGHTLKIEYQDDNMEDKELLVLVNGTTQYIKTMNGTIRESFPDGKVITTSPSGEVKTHFPDGTATIKFPDGTTQEFSSGLPAELSSSQFNLPDGIRTPDRFL